MPTPNKNSTKACHAALKAVCGNDLHAYDYCKYMINVARVYDNIVDQDCAAYKDIHDLVLDAMCNIPMNPFYQRHQLVLSEAWNVAILMWRMSDELHGPDKSLYSNQGAFIFRHSLMGILLRVAQIIHGGNKAVKLCAELFLVFENDDTLESFIAERQ